MRSRICLQHSPVYLIGYDAFTVHLFADEQKTGQIHQMFEPFISTQDDNDRTPAEPVQVYR